MKRLTFFLLLSAFQLFSLSVFRLAAQPLPAYQTPWVRTNLNYSTSAANARSRLGVAAGTNFAVAAGTGLTAVTNPGATLITFSLYTAPSISSFTNDQGTLEIGSTVTATGLGWALAGAAITSQSLNNGINGMALALRGTNHTSTYTTDRTYTLTVSDGITTPTASTSIAFSHKRYWGVSANATLTDGQVIALSKEFSATRVKGAFSLSAAAKYLYYAYPASWGAASFTVNGLPSTAWTLVTRAFVNASGNSTSFNIYRSDNLLTGTYSIEVN